MQKKPQVKLQAGGVQVKPLDNSRSAKSLTTGSLEDDVETFIKSNELLIEAPFGTSVSMSGRNLDLGEVEFKLRTNPGNEAEGSKLTKLVLHKLEELVISSKEKVKSEENPLTNFNYPPSESNNIHSPCTGSFGNQNVERSATVLRILRYLHSLSSLEANCQGWLINFNNSNK